MFSSQPGKLGAVGRKTVVQRAIAVLRRFGTNAHIYLPGVGMLNGLQAGNYLDSAGTTAGTVDQPVGLVLDAAGGLGVDAYTDVEFNTPSAWIAQTNWAVSGGVATAAGAASASSVYPSVGGTQKVIAGKMYLVTVVCSSYTAGLWTVMFEGGSINLGSKASAGTFQGYLTANLSGQFYLWSLGGLTASFESLSVREVTGIAASQPTTASKPLLRRGAVNLLTYSGDLTQLFSTAAGVITGGQADPLGGTSAQLFSGAGKNVYKTLAGLAAGQSVTHAIQCYSASGGTITIGSANGTATTSLSVSSGWGVYTFSWTSSLNDGAVVILNGSLTAITIYRQGFFQGTYTAQQIQALGGIPTTTTAPASTALGPYYFQFDGSNDSLSLGGPLFQPGDDFYCGIAATYGGTGSANKTLIEPCGTSGTAAGRVGQIGIDSATSKLHGQWVTDALTVVSLKDSAVVSVGVPFVASVSSSAGVIEFRKDAVVTATGTAPSGTTTVTGGTIGARGTSALEYFGGNTNFGVVVKGLVSTSEKMLLDKLLANFQGRSI